MQPAIANPVSSQARRDQSLRSFFFIFEHQLSTHYSGFHNFHNIEIHDTSVGISPSTSNTGNP